MRYSGLLFVVLCAAPAAGQVYRYEAEDADPDDLVGGTSVSSIGSGYSGTGYVTGFTTDNGYFDLYVDVPAGLYEMWVGYRSQYGEKGYGSLLGMGTTSYAVSISGTLDEPKDK